ncbi:hypothetical protein [Streptomyces luteogriseus]|uniref:hypothetical protein n=1 Tax=Streptomyces luteogriseus TaxID=68233 RepID=UPI00382040E5
MEREAFAEEERGISPMGRVDVVSIDSGQYGLATTHASPVNSETSRRFAEEDFGGLKRQRDLPSSPKCGADQDASPPPRHAPVSHLARR